MTKLKTKIKDVIGSIPTPVVILLLMVLAASLFTTSAYLFVSGVRDINRGNCEKLQEDLGFETRFSGDTCYKRQGDTWVPAN